jgi:hypothetical protein
MKAEWRMFAAVGAFLFGVGWVYCIWTAADSGRVEWVGTVAIFLASTLCWMVAFSLLLVSRRIPPRPEDRADAEPSDGAGEVGFFSPGSYWPAGIALAAITAAAGIVYWQLWLLGAGLAGAIVATAGLLFEYYTGSRRAQDV